MALRPPPLKPREPATGRRERQSPVVWSLEVAAAYAWRVLVIAAALILAGLVFQRLALVFLPLFLALFGTAILRPPAQWLRRRGAPPALAALAVVGAALALAAGLLALIVPPFVDQLDQLGRDLRGGVEEAGDWLLQGPLNLSERDLSEYIERAERTLRENTDAIATGALSGARIALELLAGLALALVITFFFVKDGDRISSWFMGLFPAERRAEAEEVGRRSWETLAGYLRGMTVVALFDSVFIGVSLAIIGVPAALPLAVLTFFGAYVPIVGAVVTGMAAVLVALIAEGLVPAAMVLVAVVVVQQVESNILQPFVVGRAVSVHPVAILLAVTTGGILGGVPGAIVAVPVTAVAAQVGGFLRERAEEEQLRSVRDELAAPSPAPDA